MNRRTRFLLIALAIAVAFAGWEWFRPYEWSADSGARYRIEYATVKEDHGFFWVDLQLKRSGSANHDLLKPVELITAAGREVAPSETAAGSDESEGIPTLFLRFWVEKTDLAGPLKLKLNDGTLTVRTGHDAPADSRSYYTDRW
jgi:hypothetical protein